MGRMVSKCPARVLAYGQHMLHYLKKFPDLSLRYGARRGGFGMDEELAFQRGQLCLVVEGRQVLSPATVVLQSIGSRSSSHLQRSPLRSVNWWAMLKPSLTP